MNFMFADSECSSRCESGWTLYLDNSYIAPYATFKGNDFVGEKRGKHKHEEEEEEEEEEDLSMVSDASSGAPHVHEDDYYCVDINCGFPSRSDSTSPTNVKHNINNERCFQRNIHLASPQKSRNLAKRSGKTRLPKIQKEASLLDDTASSHVFGLSSNNSALIDSEASVPNMLDFSQGYSTTHFEGRSSHLEHYGLFQPSLSGRGQEKD